MMKKQVLLLVAAASVSLLASVAQADSSVQKTPIKTPESGFYVSGGPGFTLLGVIGLGVLDKAYPSFRVDVGYQFNPHFAMGIDSYVVPFTDLDFDDSANSTHTYAPTSLYAKGIIPLSARWSLYGKLGLGAILGAALHGHNNRLDPLPFLNAGIGTNYMVTKSVGVGAEVGGAVLPFFAPTFTANVTYFFGS